MRQGEWLRIPFHDHCSTFPLLIMSKTFSPVNRTSTVIRLNFLREVFKPVDWQLWKDSMPLYTRKCSTFGCAEQPDTKTKFVFKIGWTTYNSWLAFWQSFKVFYWPKARRKDVQKSSDISVYNTINREEVRRSRRWYIIPSSFSAAEGFTRRGMKGRGGGGVKRRQCLISPSGLPQISRKETHWAKPCILFPLLPPPPPSTIKTEHWPPVRVKRHRQRKLRHRLVASRNRGTHFASCEEYTPRSMLGLQPGTLASRLNYSYEDKPRK